jgi:hypothetical protein
MLMCLSVAILILTALDDQARASVPASQIEHPTDKEKEREKERGIIDGSMYRMSPFHISMSLKVSCFKLAFWQLNIML